MHLLQLILTLVYTHKIHLRYLKSLKVKDSVMRNFKLYCMSTYQRNHNTHPKGSQDITYTPYSRNNSLLQVGTGRAPGNKIDVQTQNFKQPYLKLLVFCNNPPHICIYSHLLFTQFFIQDH